MNATTAHREEVATGRRFEFGENWRRFLATVDGEAIAEAERSLREMLEVHSLAGRSFLDIGCGSGLFSLAAVRLGAVRVHSLDFDPASVACANELRRRFAPESDWSIEQGSILDRAYVEQLGTFDVVYSWGVLHHTGDMFSALENARLPLAPGGQLFISIYNDQGPRSRIWRLVKRIYNRLPPSLRVPYALVVMAPHEIRRFAVALVRLRARDYLREWRGEERARGMSPWHDLVDWVGGYPFEVATPEVVFDFYRHRGLSLARLQTTSGLGCNQFVFESPRAAD